MSGWSDEDVELLRGYVAEGLTAGMISKRFGGRFTRNAVIGKVHRTLKMNFSGDSLSPAAAARHAEHVRELKTKAAHTAHKNSIANGTKKLPPPPRKPKPSEDLEPLGPLNDFPDDSASRPTLCRDITGDVMIGGWRCCARPVRAESVYCDHHTAKNLTRDADGARPARWFRRLGEPKMWAGL